MSDFILVDGDKAIFLPAFGSAVVAVKPGELKASGKPKLSDKKICLEGDESSVEVAGCNYISGGFVIPGVGTLKISKLASDQVAEKTKNSKPVMLVGSMFDAEFEVTSPAKQPAPPGPPVPDGNTKYKGKGNFMTTNMKWKAT